MNACSEIRSVVLTQVAPLASPELVFTDDAPSAYGVFTFDPFKYSDIGALVGVRFVLDAVDRRDLVLYPYQTSGNVTLITAGVVDLRPLGIAPLQFRELEYSLSWNCANGGYCGGAFSETYISHYDVKGFPGASANSVLWQYGWSSVDTNGEIAGINRISVSGMVEYSYLLEARMPDEVLSDGTLRFGRHQCNAVKGCWYDPDVATGYLFSAETGEFSGFTIGGNYGDGKFVLELWDSVSQSYVAFGEPVDAGIFVDLAVLDQGITKFRITGIEPDAKVNVGDPAAFAVRLAWKDGESGPFSMKPIAGSVPEPMPVSMLLAGLITMGMTVITKRRLKCL